ncbi:MAG TPA: hypothetical protein PK511_10565 [Chitinophagales bacterium]|nr:hypothetical protein [Chitinophagales bacterium]HMX04675.1 hypothetical protein [Chitinophagales bacterium]HMZ89703.1 hypothetical protein [Chitinophagales bacterium]HNA57381.1 hypothetical protein [Chitinophagales bacterium]HNF68863.1 hypothetical protein [Chitinophagales bacterium]
MSRSNNRNMQHLSFAKNTITGIIFFACVQFTNAQCVVGDCINGNGTYKLENGDMYTGNWINGVREGYGRYDWASGAYYVGNFKNNMLDGEGAFYGVDGTKMIGIFIKNNYAGTAADTANRKIYSPDDEIQKAYNDIKKRDSLAKATTLAKAERVEFCSLLRRLTTDFPNQFSSFLGERQEIVLSNSKNWYATIMATGSLEAGVNSFSGKPERSYYNILFESVDSVSALAQYAQYVEQVKTCNNGCCTMVYDESTFHAKSQSGYSTIWATLAVKEGLEPLLYNNLIIEIECLTKMAEPGWIVVLRMYDAQTLK